MNRFIPLLAALLTLPLPAAEPAPKYSVSSDFTYTSAYFFRGVKNQEQAIQPSVTLTQGDFSTGIWISQALNKKTETWAKGREIDFSGTYTHTLNDKYSVSANLTYYYYPSARPSLDEPKSTYELYLSVSGPVGPLTGKLTAARDFKYKSNSWQFDLGHSIPFAGDKGSFDLGGYFGTTDIGDFDAGLPGTGGYDYRYYGLDAGVSYQVAEKSTATLTLHWTDVSGVPPSSKNVWVSFGISTEF